MCPFCFSTMAMVVVSAASSGGLAAVIAKKIRSKENSR